MTPIDERTDRALRLALGAQPRPTSSPELAARVLRRVAERERERKRPRRGGTRLLLAAYWLAACAACAWLLAPLPRPDWLAALAWGGAVALVPAGFAVALWPERARAWLVLGLRPLLPPLER